MKTIHLRQLPSAVQTSNDQMTAFVSKSFAKHKPFVLHSPTSGLYKLCVVQMLRGKLWRLTALMKRSSTCKDATKNLSRCKANDRRSHSLRTVCRNYFS